MVLTGLTILSFFGVVVGVIDAVVVGDGVIEVVVVVKVGGCKCELTLKEVVVIKVGNLSSSMLTFFFGFVGNRKTLGLLSES